MTLPTVSWARLVAPLLFTGLLLLALVGCDAIDTRPSAAGSDSEVTIVIDTTHWDAALGEATRNAVAQWVYTHPVPERMFDVNHLPIQRERDLNRAQALKNVVFVAPLNEDTNESRFMRSVLSESARQAVSDGGTAVVSRKDQWRRGQQVFFITASDTSRLIETLQNNGPAIRDSFQTVIKERIRYDMFRRGRQHNLEDTLMANHGFAVHAQHDYQIAVDTTDFVWLRRLLTDTWRSLFVYYEEDANPADLSPEWVLTKRDSLSRIYLQGTWDDWVEVDQRRPLEIEETEFKGRYGFEMRGLWHMIGEDAEGNRQPAGMGGSFVSYAFYDEASGRNYLVDGMVFAPEYSKRDFIRQMEIIAQTFRTAEEQERTVAQAD